MPLSHALAEVVAAILAPRQERYDLHPAPDCLRPHLFARKSSCSFLVKLLASLAKKPRVRRGAPIEKSNTLARSLQPALVNSLSLHVRPSTPSLREHSPSLSLKRVTATRSFYPHRFHLSAKLVSSVRTPCPWCTSKMLRFSTTMLPLPVSANCPPPFPSFPSHDPQQSREQHADRDGEQIHTSSKSPLSASRRSRTTLSGS